MPRLLGRQLVFDIMVLIAFAEADAVRATGHSRGVCARGLHVGAARYSYFGDE